MPAPQLKEIAVKELLQSLELLYKDELARKNIEFSLTCNQSDLKLYADEKQIEQVLINLIKNAVEAMAEIPQAKILVNAYETEGKIRIAIINNGKRISKQVRENMFIPFFTTKEEGSGIGLSLSRQILRMHGATIA